MAAYPFVQFPTLREFAETVGAGHQWELKDLAGGLRDSSGQAHTLRYFERSVDGKTIQVAVAEDLDERLLPSRIRNLCRRLGVDATVFLPMG